MKKVLLVSMTHNVTDLVKAAEPDLKGSRKRSKGWRKRRRRCWKIWG